MGSSFSVVNNTSEPIWVSDGVCHAALWGSVGGVLSVVTLGAAAAAGSATAGAGAYLGAVGAFEGAIAEGALIATMEGVVYTSAIAAAVASVEAGAVVLGVSATTWSAIASISGILAVGSGIAQGAQQAISSQDESRVREYYKEVKKNLDGFERVDPGGRYTKHGSLSLVWTAYVVRNNGRMRQHNCWTGPTAGSNHEYEVTQYFS